MFLKRHKIQFRSLLEKSNVLECLVQAKGLSVSKHAKRLMKVVTNDCNAIYPDTFWVFFLRTKNWRLRCLTNIVLSKRRIVIWKLKNHVFFSKFFYHSQSATPELVPKKAKIGLIQSIIVSTPHKLTQITKFSTTFSFQKKYSLQWSNMIVPVCNDGFEWHLDFRPNLVTLIGKIHFQNWQ